MLALDSAAGHEVMMMMIVHAMLLMASQFHHLLDLLTKPKQESFPFLQPVVALM